MSKVTLTKQEEEKIINLYQNQEKSILKIHEETQIGITVIYRILKENNISIRNNNYYKSKDIDKDFFKEIDTEEKAYILGFFCADGAISNKKTFSVRIGLKDINLLLAIRKALKSNHAISIIAVSHGFLKKDGTTSLACNLSITCPQIVSDIKNHNIPVDKTHELIFPSDIPPNLIKHFIRGYFDGDGSVFLKMNRRFLKTKDHPNGYLWEKQSIGVSMVGTTSFLESIAQYLRPITGQHGNIYEDKKKHCSSFLFSRDCCLNIYHYFYNDATIWLNRKRKIFEDYFKINS